MGEGKKKLKNGTTVVFTDESGYSLTPTVSRTWALKGTIPEIRPSGGSWVKLSVISGLVVKYSENDYHIKLYFRIYRGKTIASDEIIEFLRQILFHTDGDVIVIWDNLKAHRSKKVKKFVERSTRLEITFLPSYSPDMNPDEGVWNWSKTKDLVNACSPSTDHLIHLVRGSLRRIQRRPQLRRWCLEESILTFD